MWRCDITPKTCRKHTIKQKTYRIQQFITACPTAVRLLSIGLQFVLKPDCAALQCCNPARPEQQRKGLLLLPEMYLMLQELLMSNELNVCVLSRMCHDWRDNVYNKQRGRNPADISEVKVSLVERFHRIYLFLFFASHWITILCTSQALHELVWNINLAL